jgi:hypothetical protein
MQRNIILELSIWGSVLDAQIFLEGKRIGLWQTNSTKRIRYRELPNYPITGPTLDLIVETEGKPGSSITLTIKLDNAILGAITCVNNPDSGREMKSYPI